MRVLKYGPFEPLNEFRVPGSIVYFGPQHGSIYVWSEVSENDSLEVPYEIYGTGWEIPLRREHVATTVTNGGFVWHLYVKL